MTAKAGDNVCELRITARFNEMYVIMVGDGASDVPRITTEKRREQAFKCRKRHVSPLRGSVCSKKENFTEKLIF